MRTLCLIRETLARHSGLADFAFAMQGLGSGAISLAGSDAQKRRYLPGVASGELRLQTFAVTEPNAGSETTRIETTGPPRRLAVPLLNKIYSTLKQVQEAFSGNNSLNSKNSCAASVLLGAMMSAGR